MKKFFKSLISVILLIAPTFYFGVIDKTTQMWRIVVPSVLCVVLINLDELKQSVSSIKTKNLEIQFNDAINKAYATIEQMNKTQFVLTKVTTEILHSHKYWSGCTIESSLDVVDELYDLARKSDLKEIINGPIKIAYQQIVGEAFSGLMSDIKESETEIDCTLMNCEKEDKIEVVRKVLQNIFYCNRDANIFTDSKIIPSTAAIENLIKDINFDKNEKNKFKENLERYERVLNTYQKIFGKIKLTENIPIVSEENIDET